MSFYSRFASVYERVFPLRTPVVDRMIDLLGDRPQQVLDIGCGTALLASELASRGHHCTGIDLDGAMIARAQERDPALALEVLDMADLGRLVGPFTAALCLGNVLPHLAAADLRAFLTSLRGLLEPASPWVVQTVNFDALSGRDGWDFKDLDAGDGFIFRRSYRGLSGKRCRFHTRLLRDGAVLFEGDVAMTPFRTADLVAAHREAGFGLENLHADFLGAAYEPESSPGRVFTFRRV